MSALDVPPSHPRTITMPDDLRAERDRYRWALEYIRHRGIQQMLTGEESFLIAGAALENLPIGSMRNHRAMTDRRSRGRRS